MIRVVIADDQEMVRVGLQQIINLATDMEVVGTAADGAEALEMIRRLKPDVCALDIRMPHLTGIDVTRELCKEPGGPAIVLVTTFDHDEYLFDALAAGAAGFVLKDTPGLLLAEAIRSAASGDAMLSPRPTRRLIRSLVESSPIHADLGHLLTDREHAVLEAVCQGLSNSEIGRELNIALSTVKGHIASLFAKTESTSRVGLVIWASRHTSIEL